jgi:adenosylmethionine-8-amino-7-oxononanoate aminotransferase
MKTLSRTELLDLDAQYCWHPFTQMQTAALPLPIIKGQKEFLFDTEGNQYFDAISSWWVNTHGHSNPEIAQAISNQAHELEHVMFAGVTHPPGALLAEKLIHCAPAPMAKVFYSDNGSTAIEVALKMTFQYWQNKGLHEKKRVIALTGGYHGDTFGAMSIGKSSGFYTPFSPWLFNVDFIPTGVCNCTESEALAALDQLLEQSANEIAALIIEPLIQGASGMRFIHPNHVAELCKRCKGFDVLVIFDEVFTGMGRTGTLFAAEQVAQFGGTADIICISKGLSGGFIPLAATLTSQAIYDAHLSDQITHALLHGHSYTANPLGCAAALANLALFNKEATWAQIRHIEEMHQRWLPRLACHALIENPRVCGTVAAFELKSKQDHYGSEASQWIRQTFLELGILVRPLGNTVYWVPPYCTALTTLENAYQTLMKVLQCWGKLIQPSSQSELF